MKGTYMFKYLKYRKLNKFLLNDFTNRLPDNINSLNDVDTIACILSDLSELTKEQNLKIKNCAAGLSENQKDQLFLKWSTSINELCSFTNNRASNIFEKVFTKGSEMTPLELLDYGIKFPEELNSLSRLINNCIILLKALR